MLEGYDITNMSNAAINNLIGRNKQEDEYDPDKRIEVKEVEAGATMNPHLRIKIFSAVNPMHLTETVNHFLDKHPEEILITDIKPYTFNDKGTTKHCCMVMFEEW